jgi:sRNA-binding carbon storage regulator CsrA
MLTLTVKEFEPIHIGNDITIYVKRRSGKYLRVSIDAPKDTYISRPVKNKETKQEEQSNE